GLHQVAAQPAAEAGAHDPLARLGVEHDADGLLDLVRALGVLEPAARARHQREAKAFAEGAQRAHPNFTSASHWRSAVRLGPAAEASPLARALAPATSTSSWPRAPVV